MIYVGFKGYLYIIQDPITKTAWIFVSHKYTNLNGVAHSTKNHLKRWVIQFGDQDRHPSLKWISIQTSKIEYMSKKNTLDIQSPAEKVFGPLKIYLKHQTSGDIRLDVSGHNLQKPRKSKNQTLPIGSRESFIWIILKTILCLVVDFQGKHRWFNRDTFDRQR